MLNVREYHRPESLAEAHELLTRKSPKTVVLGGGTWLTGEAGQDIEAVVDIGQLGLARTLTEGRLLRIGAGTTLQSLVTHDVVGKTGSSAGLRIIGESATLMAGLNIRNKATIAGAIVTADSASPLVTALLACDAEVVTYGVRPINSERPQDIYQVLPLAGFLSYSAQVIERGAIIVEVRVVIPSDDTRSSLERVGRTPMDYPIVCAAAQLAEKGGVVGNIRVAVGGVAPAPVRLTSLEFALEKKMVNELIDTELNQSVDRLNPTGDYKGGADYRKEMARTLARRAVMAIA
jgi:CO/xanthine dehydrogenase FAD-binding subunit